MSFDKKKLRAMGIAVTTMLPPAAALAYALPGLIDKIVGTILLGIIFGVLSSEDDADFTQLNLGGEGGGDPPPSSETFVETGNSSGTPAWPANLAAAV